MKFNLRATNYGLPSNSMTMGVLNPTSQKYFLSANVIVHEQQYRVYSQRTSSRKSVHLRRLLMAEGKSKHRKGNYSSFTTGIIPREIDQGYQWKLKSKLEEMKTTPCKRSNSFEESIIF